MYFPLSLVEIGENLEKVALTINCFYEIPFFMIFPQYKGKLKTKYKFEKKNNKQTQFQISEKN